MVPDMLAQKVQYSCYEKSWEHESNESMQHIPREGTLSSVLDVLGQDDLALAQRLHETTF